MPIIFMCKRHKLLCESIVIFGNKNTTITVFIFFTATGKIIIGESNLRVNFNGSVLTENYNFLSFF